MMKQILKTAFYVRPTLEVSRDLLGKFLVRKFPDGTETALQIHEVEAYDGFDDRASHASRGITRRNAPMFGPPGHFYVYFCYGIHWLLNIVTRPADYPAAVLIRGAGEYAGPARLTKALSIDGAHNGMNACAGELLWLEDRGLGPSEGEIIRTPRIGVGYAGPEWAYKPYRFVWHGMARDAQVRQASRRSAENRASR